MKMIDDISTTVYVFVSCLRPQEGAVQYYDIGAIYLWGEGYRQGSNLSDQALVLYLVYRSTFRLVFACMLHVLVQRSEARADSTSPQLRNQHQSDPLHLRFL